MKFLLMSFNGSFHDTRKIPIDIERRRDIPSSKYEIVKIIVALRNAMSDEL